MRRTRAAIRLEGMASASLSLLLALAALAAVAGLVGYLLGGARRAAAAAAARSEQAARLAVLESERGALTARAEAAERAAGALEERLLAETGLRTAAEATARQLDALRAELADREAGLGQLREELRTLGEARRELATRLEAQHEAFEQQRSLLDSARTTLTDTFRSLASESLRANNQSFLDLAQSQFQNLQEAARGDLERRQLSIAQLVDPVRESLEKVQGQIGAVEKERIGAYRQLIEQVESLATGQQELRRETGNLVGALRRPSVRGRWGELQLKRVVELAGMLDHVDFIEQASVTSEEGEQQRPDLVVTLPGGKSLVIDAKVPLEAYLDSLEAKDEPTIRARLADHARQIREHVTKLAQKQYWEQFEDTPDFVVLFIPGEMFYSAALEQDPGLIEAGMHKKVILATPTTLIALLRTVAYGWRQESLAADARRIAELGKELYERIQRLGEQWAQMGKGLGGAIKAYNESVATLETRVLPAARRFRDLNVGADSKEIEALPALESLPRELQAIELRSEVPADH